METLNLRIIPCTYLYNLKLTEGNDIFEQEFGIKVADGYMEFPGAMNYALEQLKQGKPIEWGSYMLIHKADNVLIGIAGYKGVPLEHIVEIGYSVAPFYRGKGYATEAARALVEYAFDYSDVYKVIAHTLPEFNSSNAVLIKCGFDMTEEVYSEEEGIIWKWEINKSNEGKRT